MSSGTLLKKFESEVELTPVPGVSNAHVIHAKKPAGAGETGVMTEEDWDRFEVDIEEAFEKIP